MILLHILPNDPSSVSLPRQGASSSEEGYLTTHRLFIFSQKKKKAGGGVGTNHRLWARGYLPGKRGGVEEEEETWVVGDALAVEMEEGS